jgi:hypothetical protein
MYWACCDLATGVRAVIYAADAPAGWDTADPYDTAADAAAALEEDDDE